MKKQIKLNDDVSVDLEKLIEGGMVILANSGGGKSYAIRRIVEQAVKNVQVIVLDPEGEFASLREKYDFILAGKGADVPVEVRSASMLATKLLELNKSAVIDLYELHPQERQRYVKLFCEALVNAPKALYHPVLIILDEAHEYVPEGKPSEATWAVEALASKGRKRGQRLILASQRIAKISKNVTAEANNKLIGRASQDIDMKRAGDELGFSKDKLFQLRQLKPGEFFAFGPAISDEILALKIGEVKTSHAKVGYRGGAKVSPPSDVIKKVLSELHDLPQEAEKEAKTVVELKKENAELKRMNTNLLKNPFQKDLTKEEIARIVAPYLKAKDEEIKKIEVVHGMNVRFIEAVVKDFDEIMEICNRVKLSKPPKQKIEIHKIPMRYSITDKRPAKEELLITNMHVPKKMIRESFPTSSELPENKPLIGGALRMLKILVSRHPVKLTKAQLGTFSKLKPTSGTFGTYLSILKSKGYILHEDDLLMATEEGIVFLGETPNPPQSSEELISMWKENLTGGTRRIFEYLISIYPEYSSKEDLGLSVGIVSSSGTFGTYLSILKSNNLIEMTKAGIKASDNLYDL